jgi:carboxyl-terminal processing protease
MKAICNSRLKVYALCLLLLPSISSAWLTPLGGPTIVSSSVQSPTITSTNRIRGLHVIKYNLNQQGYECDSSVQPSFKLFDVMLRQCGGMVSSMMLTGVLLLLGPTLPVAASPDSNVISSSTTTVASSTSSTTTTQNNVVEEVWTLIDKYYIDRTYGGQNWKVVRDKYIPLSLKASNDDVRFKLASEMVASLNDKYSRMLSRDQYSAIQKYDLIGVGVTLMPDSNKNIIVGAPPIPNSEAARVGMQVGDYVTEINGVSTAGRTAFDIIDQISEDPSAKTVTMTVRPKGSTAADPVKVVSMSRAFAAVKNPVQYKISETRSDGTKVGYIRISEFNALVKASLEKALSDLEAAGVNAYVIDIRQNTGGAFQSAVEISSLFTEGRVATYVVDNTNVKLPFRTATGQLAIDSTDPIVMLIDGRSASASEVLAGSLHDNCRAVLMGEKSFGKGLIQAVYGLKNGEGLVMTVARYITPSGSDIQGVGITPDFPTPPSSYLGPLRNIGTISFGMDMDTTKIDFKSIQSRLQNVCKIPDEMK